MDKMGGVEVFFGDLLDRIRGVGWGGEVVKVDQKNIASFFVL